MAKTKQISDKSPRKLAKDKQRQHLLNANIECIAKLGLSDTSITHISKAAEMSRGIINFYFESKEKMMLETLDYVLKQQDALWQSAIEKADAKTLLSDVADKLLLTPSRRHQRAWIAFAAHAASHSDYAKKFDASKAELKKTLLAKNISSEQASNFLTLLNGIRIELLLNKASFSQQEKQNHIAAVVGMLSSEKQHSSNDNIVPKPTKVTEKTKPVEKAKASKGKKADNADAAIGDLFASLG